MVGRKVPWWKLVVGSAGAGLLAAGAAVAAGQSLASVVLVGCGTALALAGGVLRR